MKITNNSNLPEPVVLALSEDTYSRGDSNRSVTQLIDSARAQILRGEHEHEIVEDVTDFIWIALGKTLHLLFEKHAGGKYRAEERLFAEVDGWTVSGAIDIQVDEATGIVSLCDYKCTSVWSVIFGKDDWHNQLNFYAWLVEQARPAIKVSHLKILVVLRDWKKSEKERKGKEYPEHPIMEILIPLWSEAKRDNYVHDRVAFHQDAEFKRLTGDKLPLCTDKERWKNAPKFAVIKKGNKTAKRVLNSLKEAEDWIVVENQKQIDVMDKYLGILEKFDEDKAAGSLRKGARKPVKPKPVIWTIEERPSVPTRCEKGWCRAAPWCDQYQEELGCLDLTQ